jgi:hypothetical protein
MDVADLGSVRAGLAGMKHEHPRGA